MERWAAGRPPPDVLAGGMALNGRELHGHPRRPDFVGFGLAFAVGSLRYELGTPLRMGPGYFPLLVGGILAALGLADRRARDSSPARLSSFGSDPWRAVAAIVLAVALLRIHRPAARIRADDRR